RVQLYIRYSHYISCPHQSAPITVPPYIRYSCQSAPLHSKYPFTSYFPIRVLHYIIFLIRVPFYIIFLIRVPFHHMCQSDCPFPSHMPIRVPLNIKCAVRVPLN
ncbi:unnamed protein product, partial [Staurois parvus]